MSQSTSGEHQELVERFEAEVSEHIADHAAPSAEHTVSNTRAAGEQSYYLVGLANIGDFTYSVRIAYRTSDHPSETQVIDVTHPAGTQINFRLTDPGQCASLVAYLIG